jgi:dienelactone hydrolase
MYAAVTSSVSLALWCGVSIAHAQVNLNFPKEPLTTVVHGPGMALYGPQGAGPFPAVVLSHTCATLGSHVTAWADRLVKMGHVALVLDHLTPRGVKFNCPYNNPISVTVFAQDAAAGLKHLRTLPFVDGNRVAHIGFSYGAMAGLRLASASFRKRSAIGERFAAVVSFYPWCNEVTPTGGDHQVNYYGDIDVPLLMLLGAADDDSPPATCIAEGKKSVAKGQPVSWKLYPNATHGFDFAHLGKQPMKVQTGKRVATYRYNPEATTEAGRDLQNFLTRHMPAKPSS